MKYIGYFVKGAFTSAGCVFGGLLGILFTAKVVEAFKNKEATDDSVSE